MYGYVELYFTLAVIVESGHILSHFLIYLILQLLKLCRARPLNLNIRCNIDPPVS